MAGEERRGSSRDETKDERAQRLAAALRENLKRRKAQARGRQAAEARPERPDETGG